jgi:exodeoxyribonuclease V beta subunit
MSQLKDHPVLTTRFDQRTVIQASAGTGKTWTLSGLYIRALLEQALPVEKILVLTFTIAATAELKERIQARIAQALAWFEAPGSDVFLDAFMPTFDTEQARREASLRLQIAAASADQMAIMTINGFCQRLLSRGFGGYGMGDQPQVVNVANTQLAQVVDEFMVAFTRHASAAVLIAQRPSLVPATQRQWRSALAHQTISIIKNEIGFLQASEQLVATFYQLQQTPPHELDQFVKTTVSLPQINKRSFNTNVVSEFAEQFVAQVQSGVFGLLSWNWIQTAAWTNDKLFKDLGPPADLPNFVRLIRQYIEQASVFESPDARLLIDFREFAGQRLVSLKQAAGVLEQDDLVMRVRGAILDPVTGEAMAHALAQLYPLVLIDESQDTGAVAWSIFDQAYPMLATRTPNDGALLTVPAVCLVGDPKQTIYSFRGADVEQFLSVDQTAQARASLAHNQRSSHAMVEAVNVLFSVRDAFSNDRLVFQNSSAGRNKHSSLQSSELIAAVGIDFIDEQGTRFSQPRANANALAWVTAQVATFLSAEQPYTVTLLQEPARAIRASDIGILVRSNNQAKAVKLALARAGIAAVESSDALVTQSQEGLELQLILRACVDWQNRGYLHAAFSTRLWGLNAEQLIKLANDGAFFEQQLNVLMLLASNWSRKGAYYALTVLWREQDVHARFFELIDGARRLTNIQHLAELLGNAEPSLNHVAQGLSWLVQAREQAQLGRDGFGAEVRELRLETDSALVQISTIHKAKGLEYPIVLMPFAALGSKQRQTDQPVLDHPPENSFEPRLDFRAPIDSAVDQRARQQVQAESARQLYVAITRAQVHCALLWQEPEQIDHCGLRELLQKHAQVSLTEGLATPSDQPLINVWQGLADQHPASFKVRHLEQQDLEVSSSLPSRVATPNVALVARGEQSLPVVVKKSAWSITSYSALISRESAQTGARATDYDVGVSAAINELTQEPASEQRSSIKLPDARIEFPKGSFAGQFLHTLFERVEFSKGFDAQLVSAVGSEYGLVAQGSSTAHWLNQVLATPLTDRQFSLSQIAPQRMIREMEFLLRTDPPSISALQTQMAKLGLASLDVTRLRGFMRGFIDLVFEYDGKFYILDWKSNYLGSTPADYCAQALTNSMQVHHYDLQAMLYTCAVHRFLSSRLAENSTSAPYAYDTHFGGVLYLFVRAVGAQADQPSLGVVFTRPLLAQVSAFDHAMGGMPND